MVAGEAFIHRVVVRPSETDRMGVVHHSRYAVYFEEARTELLRRSGLSYGAIEDAGCYLVVAELETRFRRPCRLGDTLEIECRVSQASFVTIRHEYAVRVEGQEGVAVEAKTRLACVDAHGRPRKLPEELLRLLGVE
jgi:acyl-CoA thioester hydrolase